MEPTVPRLLTAIAIVARPQETNKLYRRGVVVACSIGQVRCESGLSRLHNHPQSLSFTCPFVRSVVVVVAQAVLLHLCIAVH